MARVSAPVRAPGRPKWAWLGMVFLLVGASQACAAPLPVASEPRTQPASVRPASGPSASARVAACLAAAAAHHQVDPALLRAIAVVESGLNPQAMGARNRNGTHDIGLMQVNSSWLPRLARFGIDAQGLRDPCVSAYVGAWILADNIRRHGPVWRAVGAYNARTPSRQVIYVEKVQRELARRTGVSVAAPGRGSAAPGH